MMRTAEICQNERRRSDVRESPDLSGMDYVEVSDDQLVLTVYFLGKAPKKLHEKNPEKYIQIQGGRRITDIKIVDVDVPDNDDPDADDYMDITVNRAGDFSTYTLSLVELHEYKNGTPVYRRLQGTDPRYYQVDFTFKAGCASDLDCNTTDVCPATPFVQPEINYLAKDYTSFRQLILDRLALTIPDWQERHIPDIGITLVEVLAYVGDYLSYYQDAVATEAYLETARQRISVRRHVRLVDYKIHEGCNARTWVFVWTSPDLPDKTLWPGDIAFITGQFAGPGMDTGILTQSALLKLPPDSFEVFEPLVEDLTQPLRFYEAHNAIWFYTWGDTECCLPRGATSATLQDYVHDDNAEKEYQQAELAEDEAQEQQDDQEPAQPQPKPTAAPQQPAQSQKSASATPPKVPRILHMKEGDFLLFEEVKGAKTGVSEDANVMHRQVVRLTGVKRTRDALKHKNVLEVEWAVEDALTFPVCISVLGPAPDCALIENISVARGNILLVDHGQTITGTQSIVPTTVPLQTTIASCATCEKEATDVQVIAGPYQPILQQEPLTYSQPLTSGTAAALLLSQNPRLALPQVTLTSTPGDFTILYPGAAQPQQLAPSGHSTAVSIGMTTRKWTAVYDLLESSGQDNQFVVETDNDSSAHLRFGNGELGRAPEPLDTFSATYRVGNGSAGNIGADSIAHIVLPDNKILNGAILRPRNPVAAQGGTQPEPLTEIKLLAPTAYRSQLERAITADDYALLAAQHPSVRQAVASLRWAGSGYDALVAIAPQGTDNPDPTLLQAVATYLEPYRRIGYDISVVQASYVALTVSLSVCVLPHYLKAHVKAALLQRFSNAMLPDGTRGFFHPDKLMFGESIAVSELIAAAQAIPGVMSVTVAQLERLGDGPNEELQRGVLLLGPMEIAQLDNDPNYPEHGTLIVNMRGGR